MLLNGSRLTNQIMNVELFAQVAQPRQVVSAPGYSMVKSDKQDMLAVTSAMCRHTARGTGDCTPALILVPTIITKLFHDQFEKMYMYILN